MKRQTIFMRIVFNYALCIMNCALITSCSQDETLTQDDIPIVLNAKGISAGQATRSTIDGNWEGVSTVNVSIDGGSTETWNVSYTTDKTKATIAPSSTKYWSEYLSGTKTSVPIVAWYPTSFAKPANNGTVTIATDQSNEATYKAQDIIYAYNGTASSTNQTLTFKHLMARITINLMKNDYLEANKNNISVTLTADQSKNCWSRKGKYSGSNGSLEMQDGDDPVYTLTPYKLTTPNSGFFATYDVIIVPQCVNQSHYVTVKVGNATYKWEMKISGSNDFLGGNQYIYNITVTPTGISVTTASASISWTEGGTGSGSVTMD